MRIVSSLVRIVGLVLCVALLAWVVLALFPTEQRDPAAIMNEMRDLSSNVSSYDVKGNFRGKRDEISQDLSGMACVVPLYRSERTCLAIDDELQAAQYLSLNQKNKTLTPGKMQPLIDKDQIGAVLGRLPEVDCVNSERPKFKELDGEGVAYQAPYFYVVGSHGCARKSGKFKSSVFILTRVRVDQAGQPVGERGSVSAIEATFRLTDVLKAVAPLSTYFGKKLRDGNKGLNIEGLAVDGDKLIIALRAPVLAGKAFLVVTELAPLFDPEFQPGAEGGRLKAEVISVALGPEVGFRDVARLPDGRLLLLTGPANTQAIPYQIYLFDLKSRAPAQLLSTVKTVTAEYKAESLTVLGVSEGRVRVLVLFDGVLNGAPRELILPLP